MKKLSFLLSFLFLLSFSYAQTDIQHDTRVHTILKQAVAKTPGLIAYGRYNSSMLVNMAVLNTATHTMNWFTCHGRFFDCTTLTGEEYRAIITKVIDPFTLYQNICNEYLTDIKAVKNIYRLSGKQDAFRHANANYQAVFASQPVQAAKTPLQKLMAIEGIQKRFVLQLAYFNCNAPTQLPNNSLFSIQSSQLGKMVKTKDSTVYYNVDPVASINRIVLYKNAPEKLYVYNHQVQLKDSVSLLSDKYNLLLKEKTDVFLLYRGWLEMQWQEVAENALQLIKNEQADSLPVLYRQVYRQDNTAELYALYRQINAIETKINAAVTPETKIVEQVVYDQYKNEPSELSYATGMGVGYTFTEVRGRKVYELANHLGNVLATVSDRRNIISTNDSTVDHYEADVVNATDYYAFGMEMPGRVYNGGTYRYGYNGKENDNDVKGEGNQQDYGMRIYDPRLGRFLSVDPIAKKYPELTPYQFASNRPIDGVDQDGLEFEEVGLPNMKIREYESELWKKDPEHAGQIILEDNIRAFMFVGGALTAGYGGSIAARIGFRPLLTNMLKGGVVGGSVNAAMSLNKGEKGYELVKSATVGFFSGSLLGLGWNGSLASLLTGGAWSSVAGEIASQEFDKTFDNGKFSIEKIMVNGGIGAVANVLSSKLVDGVIKAIDAKLAKDIAETTTDTYKKTIKKAILERTPRIGPNQLKTALNETVQNAQDLLRKQAESEKVAVKQAIERGLDFISSNASDVVNQSGDDKKK